MHLGERFEPACRQLLRAAYLGTLLAAVTLHRKQVVLTLIGGGVFSNPVPLIWESIVWALEQVEPVLAGDIDVIVNGRALGRVLDLDAVVLPAARAREGAVLAFDRSDCVTVRR